MKHVKIFLAGTLSNITKKTSMEFKEADDNVETILDILIKVDQYYNYQILPEINEKFNLIFEKDDSPPQLIPINKINDIKLGKNNVIKFFYRFTGG